MNIQNISTLEKQLISLGFKDVGYPLLKRMAFKLSNFVLTYKIEKDQHPLTFNLFFEKLPSSETYILMYYDAIFQKDSIPAFVNGVDISSLEQEIQSIDWAIAFDLNTFKESGGNFDAEYINESRIEKVMEAFLQLESSEEGRAIATNLKVKYWAGANYQELFGNLTPVRTKSEISQRFYFSDEHNAISVNEAYRFLQNKWLEKEIKERKKESAGTTNELQEDSETASNGSLLRKRQQSGSKKTKKALSK